MKIPKIFTLYIFFLVFFVIQTLASATVHYCRHDQRDALLEFKQEFPVNESHSTPSNLTSWNNRSDCCSWYGVKCEAKSGKVISLRLFGVFLNSTLKQNSALFKLQYLQDLVITYCYLTGEIPSTLGNLSRLESLDLSGNELVGQVPASVGNLTQLRELRLSRNKLSGISFFKLQYLQYLTLSYCNLNGEILSSLRNFSSLTHLYLSGNELVTQIPASIGHLTQLKYLSLYSCNLNGEIPSLLTNLSSLTYLDLSGNELVGQIPAFIGNLTQLSYLHLSENKLSGNFPVSFFNLANLLLLDLDDNNFKSKLPTDIGRLQNLEDFSVSNNSFFGPLPESISKLLNLSTLDLSHNDFIGQIPGSIPQLVKLSRLDLSNNKLEGKVPSCLWKLVQLDLAQNSFSSFGKSSEVGCGAKMEFLRLKSNMFEEPLPHWICKFQGIGLLDLSNNSFSGPIPQCFKNITNNLQTLDLHNNSLSGIFPDVFVNSTNLDTLDISHNKFEGIFPKSLINCKSMRYLNVESNKFKDKFPAWLGSLPLLNVLLLRSNQLYGPLYHHNVSIGFPNIKVIDVSHNDFIGSFPTFYFSGWQRMATLNSEDEDTYMEDWIYLSTGYMQNLNSMEMVHKGVDTQFKRIQKDYISIDFSGNKFYGKIPKSIGLLKGLRHLNLSSNAFFGNLPKCLVNLTNLETLDVSQNQLTGQISKDLGTLSFLSVMNFSHNYLEGPIPQGTQFQSQNCSSFMDNPKLYGLEEICGKTHVMALVPQKSETFSEPNEQVISWIAAAIAYGSGVFCGLVIGHIFVSHKHEWLMEYFDRIKHKVVIRRGH